MKKPFGIAMISWMVVSPARSDVSQGRTSVRMSLCNRTPRRMFAIVRKAMMTRPPTIIPCDHASSVKLAGVDGLAGPWSSVPPILSRLFEMG